MLPLSEESDCRQRLTCIMQQHKLGDLVVAFCSLYPPSFLTCFSPLCRRHAVKCRNLTGNSRIIGFSSTKLDGYKNFYVSTWFFGMLLISNLPMFSFTPSTPEISAFTVNQLRHFIDRSNSETFFHHLSIDPFNASSLYIGALDFVYRLNADNINITFERSENITNFSNFSKIYASSVTLCRYVPKSSPDYQCRNHVRGILPNFNGRELYVCGTGSYSPQDFYLDMKTLKVLRIGYDPNDPVGGGSGITKCPYDPDTNHTIIYVGRNSGNPNNLSAIYSSLLVEASYNYAIYRSAIQRDFNSPVEFSPIRFYSNHDFGELFYIASFEIDQYVYFFFRELAGEASNCGHIHYSRVGRVCKNDKGGTLQRSQFLTYVKARLNCSIGTDDIPVYFHELYDVQYDNITRIFYGLFMTNRNSMWGSAVCQYSYTDIRNKFDNDPFFAQEKTDTEWTITSDSMVPKPRPSLCQSDTLSLSITAQSFALSHTLMYGTVNHATRSPLYYTQDVSYSHFAVDVFGQFNILYLYSASVPDEILRVVQWVDEEGQVHSRKISILKPFINNRPSTVWDMKIYTVNQNKWIYVVTEKSVIQVSVNLCSAYKLCTDCVQDPYCSWNSNSASCESSKLGNSFQSTVQRIMNSIAVCKSACKITSNIKVLPGTAVHMKCSSHCSSEGAIIWKFQRTESAEDTTIPVMSDPNYVLSWNNGLVVLNITRNHTGTFRCLSDDIIMAEYNVTMSACEYGEDVREIWIREFVSWCKAFDQYQDQYGVWLCLRDKCLNKTCVSSDAIATCSKGKLP